MTNNEDLYHDGLPDNPMYVVGLDDTTGIEPTAYTCTATEVFKSRIAPTNAQFYTCNAIDVSDLKIYKYKKGNYIDIDLNESDHKVQTLHNVIDRSMPENLIDIPKEQISKILAINKDLTDQVAKILLEQGTTSLMSFDAASAYTETVLRDGLKVGAKLDTDVSVALAGILKLSIISKYISTFDLPSSVRKTYLAKMTELVVNQNHEDMKKHSNAQKHSSLLQTLAGRISKDNSNREVGRQENRTGLGVGRGNSGRKITTKEPEEPFHDFQF
jgi:hypothetical protein